MKCVFLLFLLVILPLASAARVDFYLNQSLEKDGKNITLIDLNKDKEKALVCVNNEKIILSKNKAKTTNDVFLELKQISKDKVNIEVKVYCEKCECDQNCLNLNCTSLDHQEIENEIHEITEIVSFEEKESIEVVENNGLTNINLLWASLILILLIILIYFLVKKR